MLTEGLSSDRYRSLWWAQLVEIEHKSVSRSKNIIYQAQNIFTKNSMIFFYYSEDNLVTSHHKVSLFWDHFRREQEILNFLYPSFEEEFADEQITIQEYSAESNFTGFKWINLCYRSWFHAHSTWHILIYFFAKQAGYKPLSSFCQHVSWTGRIFIKTWIDKVFLSIYSIRGDFCTYINHSWNGRIFHPYVENFAHIWFLN